MSAGRVLAILALAGLALATAGACLGRPAALALSEAAGRRLAPGARNGSDAWFFMRAGIPAITIGNTGFPGLGLAGFHTTDDNLERANIANLELTVRVLERYIEAY